VPGNNIMISTMTPDKEDREWVDGAAAAFDFVRFTTSDIHGISRSKLIPRRHVDEKLKSGITMCSGKLYTGWSKTDCVLTVCNFRMC